MSFRRLLGESSWANVLALALGGPLLLAGAFLVALGMVKGGISGVFIFLGALVPLGAGAVLVGPVVAGWIGQSLGSAVYWPRLKGTLAPEYSAIQALIAAHDYGAARAELETRLEASPGDPTLVALLAELLMDKLQDLRSAAGLLAVYFERGERAPGDWALALRLADAYLDLGRRDLALAILRDELSRGHLGQAAQRELSRRLAGIEENP
jgi:hypothetical protein